MYLGEGTQLITVLQKFSHMADSGKLPALDTHTNGPSL